MYLYKYKQILCFKKVQKNNKHNQKATPAKAFLKYVNWL